MIGVELVVGWLTAYVWRKARRMAGRADGEVDRVLDSGMDRLHDLIAAKLGADPCLAKLTAEAAADLSVPSVSARTRQRVELALVDAVESDAAFAADLDAIMAGLRRAHPSTAVATGTGTAQAGGGGVAKYRSGRSDQRAVVTKW